LLHLVSVISPYLDLSVWLETLPSLQLDLRFQEPVTLPSVIAGKAGEVHAG